MAELSFDVIHRVCRTEPENPSPIRVSDPLWHFVQRCWGGDVELRQKAAEVVERLGVAVDRNGVMSPSVEAENTISSSWEPMSDSMNRCEFEHFILP